MKYTRLLPFFLCFFILLTACKDKDDAQDWLIPTEEVRDGGPGKDGIPSIDNPQFSTVANTNFLEEDDLVIGVKVGNTIKAYPHPILDWHEIVNDKVDDLALAITYCPLTGTAIGWERTLAGQETTFGVSGLLYNSNLIPYDRASDSNWSQMRLDCVNGERIGNTIKTYSVVETTWKTWKSWFPDSEVMQLPVGNNRDYDRYPYGGYKTNPSLLFPVDVTDDRLSAKTRCLGVVQDGEAKVYPYETFTGMDIRIVQDNFRETDLVIVGSRKHNYMVAFKNKLSDGTTGLMFTVPDTAVTDNDPSIVLEDEGGSLWNIFGEAVSGPRTGQRLDRVESYIGYWFSWGAFYPGAELF